MAYIIKGAKYAKLLEKYYGIKAKIIYNMEKINKWLEETVSLKVK